MFSLFQKQRKKEKKVNKNKINVDTFIFFHSICFQTREKTTEAKL